MSWLLYDMVKLLSPFFEDCFTDYFKPRVNIKCLNFALYLNVGCRLHTGFSGIKLDK